jgi:hypothetical protein
MTMRASLISTFLFTLAIPASAENWPRSFVLDKGGSHTGFHRNVYQWRHFGDTM